LLTTEQSFSEKEEPGEGKKRWRERRLWGKIPMSVVVVVLVLLIVFAIALGAAIGTVVAKKHQKDKDKDSNHGRPQDEP
jgi:flagellar basal body-associated protein FliL